MYKYYILHNVQDEKRIYGVIKETKRYITCETVQSTKVAKGKKVIFDKNTITNNINQFDFTQILSNK